VFNDKTVVAQDDDKIFHMASPLGFPTFKFSIPGCEACGAERLGSWGRIPLPTSWGGWGSAVSW